VKKEGELQQKNGKRMVRFQSSKKGGKGGGGAKRRQDNPKRKHPTKPKKTQNPRATGLEKKTLLRLPKGGRSSEKKKGWKGENQRPGHASPSKAAFWATRTSGQTCFWGEGGGGNKKKKGILWGAWEGGLGGGPSAFRSGVKNVCAGRNREL